MFEVIKNKTAQKYAAVSAVVVGGMGSNLAFADATGDAIDAAVEAAKTNVTAVVIGVLAVAAICFGVGLIVSHLRK